MLPLRSQKNATYRTGPGMYGGPIEIALFSMTAGDESPLATSSRPNEPGLGDRLGVPGADNVKAARNRNEHIYGKSQSEC